MTLKTSTRMIDNQELLFIVDENNQPLKPVLRSIAHKNGFWHRTTGVWVINRKKQILCQKRSLENYQHNAASELSEELGIAVNENDLIPYKVLKSDKPTHKEFQQIFALVLNDNQELKFEKDEIDQLVWKDLEEVRKILIDEKNVSWVQKPWDKEALDWLTAHYCNRISGGEMYSCSTSRSD